jgi:hypothetical protein
MADMEKLGALWVHESKNGNKYLSGKFGEIPIIIFKNSKKEEGEKTPDWIIYKSKPREDGGI